MDKFEETLTRIVKYGPEPQDFLLVFGLIVACIVVALGSVTSVVCAFGYLVVGFFSFNVITLLVGLLWCIALAFFVTIIIIAHHFVDDIKFDIKW